MTPVVVPNFDLWHLGIAVVALLSIPALAFLRWRPRAALASGVMLVLLASTKFRHRDPYALLSGSFDAQVLYELALYGLLLLITLRAALLPALSAYRITRVAALLGGYVGIALLSVFWSANLGLTFVRAGQLLVLLVYAFVAVNVLGAQRILRVTAVSVLLYVAVFAGMAHTFQFANGTTLSDIPRFSWFAVHPIGAGVFAATAALFLLVQVLFPPRAERAGWMFGVPVWLLIPFCVWVLLATQSRGPIFAFIFAAGLLLIRKYAVGSRALLTSDRVLLGLLAIGVTLFMVVITGRRGRRISAFLLRGQSPDEFLSLTGRTSLWDVAFHSYAQRPVFGHGYLSARDVLLRQVEWGGHAHNAIIDSLFSVGLLGASILWAAFLVVLGASFLRTFRMPPSAIHDHALVCAGMAFLLFNAVTGDSFAGVPGYEPLLLFILVLAEGALIRDAQQLHDGAVRSPTMPALLPQVA